MFTTVSTEAIEAYVKGHVCERRFIHSQGTAELARRMAKVWKLDPEKAWFAGISHDMCKEMPADDLLRLVKGRGERLEPWFIERPKLLHGQAAAILLEEEFGVTDPDILEAVREHTFGSPSMGDLAKIVYCADKLEPSRTHVSEVFREKCLAGGIDRMLATVVGDSIEYLTKEKKAIAEPTLSLYAALARRKA